MKKKLTNLPLLLLFAFTFLSVIYPTNTIDANRVHVDQPRTKKKKNKRNKIKKWRLKKLQKQQQQATFFYPFWFSLVWTIVCTAAIVVGLVFGWMWMWAIAIVVLAILPSLGVIQLNSALFLFCLGWAILWGALFLLGLFFALPGLWITALVFLALVFVIYWFLLIIARNDI